MIEIIQNRDIQLRNLKNKLANKIFFDNLEDLSQEKRFIVEKEFRKRYKIKW